MTRHVARPLSILGAEGSFDARGRRYRSTLFAQILDVPFANVVELEAANLLAFVFARVQFSASRDHFAQQHELPLRESLPDDKSSSTVLESTGEPAVTAGHMSERVLCRGRL